ncbi:hypothetical protein IU487_36540, partial [Nocardia puris]
VLGLDTATTPTLGESERIYLAGYLAALQAIPVQGQPVLPESAPLSDRAQAWVNGLLAGMYSRAAETPTAPADSGARVITVLWASQTGTAEELAT